MPGQKKSTVASAFSFNTNYRSYIPSKSVGSVTVTVADVDSVATPPDTVNVPVSNT